jgi:hypothetical protein
MARSARTTAGINAGAWFAAQSFHHSTTIATPATPATPAAAPPALFGADTAADTQFYAGLLLEAFDTREVLEAEAEDRALIADRDLEREAAYRADREGDACGTACGYCGRCS